MTMRRFTPYASFSLFWIYILFASAVRKDICERCMKIEECPSFAHLNKHEQQVWLEQVPCEGPQTTGGTTISGFSPIAKGDYICCPNSNIWDNKNSTVDQSSDTKNTSKRSPETEHIKPNDSDGQHTLQPFGFQNQNSYPIQDYYRNQQIQPGNGNIYGNEHRIPNTQNLYGNQNSGAPYNTPFYPNNQNYQGIYGPYENGQFNHDFFNNQLNGPIGQNIFGIGLNGPRNQGVYGQNPNYLQYPSNPIWSNPTQPSFGGQIQNGWQNPNAYPQQQNPHYNNGNGNLFQTPNLNDQCAVQTNLLPDPQSRCCGRDMSATERITDLQNLLHIYAPSRSWRSANAPQREPHEDQSSFPQEQKLSIANDTADVVLDNRITGGKETELDQFPWTVLLKTTFDYGNKQESYSCGGSLISGQYVLTAGHCVFEQGAKLIGIEVTLAEYDKRTFPRDCKSEMGRKSKCIDNILMYAEDIILHPQYDDDQLHNDIALVRLHGYAPYTRYIRPICLPLINIDNDDLSNLPLAVAGWGRNGPYVTDIKQSTVVHLIPHDECQKSYPHLSKSHLCAAGRTGEDTCKGDSGGPLMMLFGGTYYVIGVVSGKRADSPCGTSVPSLYANVFQYVPWIKSNIKN